MNTTFQKISLFVAMVGHLNILSHSATADTLSVRNNDSEKIKVNVLKCNTQKQFKVAFEVDEATKSVKIRVKDMENRLLFLQNVKNRQNYITVLDMKSLPNGEYYVEFDTGDTKIRRQIIL